MPEPAAWRYQKITKPMFDLPVEERILAGRVLTMAGDVIEDGFVHIAGGRIVAVGARGDMPAGNVTETGGTIMPGLINSHAHLNWDGIHDLARQSMDDPKPISAFKAAGNMLKSLRAGITMVRDLGFHDMNLYSKQAVEQGIFPGPRLKVCGAAIIQTGGHTYWVCREASGADEMRRAVREQVKGGADLIKIMACHDTLEFTDEELHAVIDEAHRNRLPVTAHATYDACIARVAAAGVDCIEHGGSMSDSTIDLLLEKGSRRHDLRAPRPAVAARHRAALRHPRVEDRGADQGRVGPLALRRPQEGGRARRADRLRHRCGIACGRA
jgi:imidazolonepropionase-like amidohydrolase